MILKVEGMSCKHCQKRVEETFLKHGIEAIVDLDKKEVSVKSDLSKNELTKIVEEAGYKVI